MKNFVCPSYPTLISTTLILITFESIFTEFTDADKVLLSSFKFWAAAVISGSFTDLSSEQFDVVGAYQYSPGISFRHSNVLYCVSLIRTGNII